MNDIEHDCAQHQQAATQHRRPHGEHPARGQGREGPGKDHPVVALEIGGEMPEVSFLAGEVAFPQDGAAHLGGHDGEAAARLAREFGHVNGYAEGVDGAVFCATLVSLAFTGRGTPALVREAARVRLQVCARLYPYRLLLITRSRAGVWASEEVSP